MAFSRVALMIVALFVEVRGSQDIESDVSSFLQAGMQEKAAAQQEKVTDETSSISCDSFETKYKSGEHETSLDEEKVSTCATPMATKETVADVPCAVVQEDPPGAAAFKAFLELAIVCLFVDGLRRWRIQCNEAARQKKAPESSAADDAVDRAWQELLKAASSGDEPGFKKMDLNKSLIKREDTWGCTALHFAATGGSTEIATDLLQLGAKVDAVDSCEETALHFAARAGHVSMCDLLMNNGANVNPLNEQDMTPLVVAGHAKQEATCRFLVDHGGHAGGMADEDLPLMVVGQVMRKVLEGA
jgi:hypothetical protein